MFFKARALPSAGVLPFLQSFFCDYNNSATFNQTGLPDFSNTRYFKHCELNECSSTELASIIVSSLFFHGNKHTLQELRKGFCLMHSKAL